MAQDGPASTLTVGLLCAALGPTRARDGYRAVDEWHVSGATASFWARALTGDFWRFAPVWQLAIDNARHQV